MGNKPWKQSELDYLQDSWGQVSLPGIAKHLGRTLTAIRVKAFRLELGRHLHCSEKVTLNQLFQALHASHSYSVILMKKYGAPIKTMRSVKMRYLVIDIDDFFNWAKEHKEVFSFARLEPCALGPEPQWVKEKRMADQEKSAMLNRTSWTEFEDSTLKSLLNEYKYGYREIAAMLHRSEGAIKRRIYDLKLKAWPLAEPKQGIWTPELETAVISMHEAGYCPDIIARHVNKSAQAIRGKLERLCI